MSTNICKIALSSLLTIGALTLSSCNNFLEENPYDFISVEDLDDSQESIDYLVTGVYSKWCNNIFRYDTLPAALEKDSDYISGATWNFSDLGSGNFSDSSEIEGLWENGYSLIDRCNTALELIEPMQNATSNKAKANAIAEICFNKAYMYFLLTRAFGEIPLPSVSTYTLNIQGESLYGARQPIADVYAEIIRLLEIAEDDLYAIDETSYVVGHVARGTAAGMLAKVYATMASGALNDDSKITVRTGEPCDPSAKTTLYALETMTFTKTQVAGYESFDTKACYDKVIEYCEKLESGYYGDYDLIDYDEMWKHDAFNKISDVEYMFTIYSVSGNEIYGNKISRNYCYTAESDGGVYKGLWVGQRNHWYMLFDDDHDDRRITDGVIHNWQAYEKDYGTFYPNTTVSTYYYDLKQLGEYPYNDGLTYSTSSSGTNLAYTTKYFNVTDRTLEYTDAYFSMLRYADVLLLYAEALNETRANVTLAKELVTRVRVRSRYTATVDEIVADDLESVRSVILEERAKELACEADRRWDLIRWGIYVDAMNAIGGSDEVGNIKSRQSKHLLYPIPVDEILANEFITENNPGWN
ncbi:MAG: RagB/SusD family nutrient uptake outer membrane protein [Rikenellaceae bacterium]